jgi:hypothetical protein
LNGPLSPAARLRASPYEHHPELAIEVGQARSAKIVNHA